MNLLCLDLEYPLFDYESGESKITVISYIFRCQADPRRSHGDAKLLECEGALCAGNL